MSRIRLSVAIATVDRPEALARCLDALAAGSAAPQDVLVVDQGRNPATRAVVEERADLLPLRRLEQDRLGLSASRNLALRETEGDALAVTDDDCVPSAGWVAAVVETLGRAPAIAGVTGPMLPCGPEAPGLAAVSSRTSGIRTSWQGRPAPWLVGTGANMAVRRDWLERVGGWDERLGVGTRAGAGEDLALVDRLLTAGAVLRYEPEAVVRHERRTPASRRVTRWSYGRGVGAWCGLLLRDGDAGGATMLARWGAMRMRLAGAAVARRHGGALLDEARVVAGTVGGLVHGLRARGQP